MLALVQATVVEVPELGALVLRVPLAELVPVGVDALLGAGLLLVATTTAKGGREAVLLDGVEQRPDLEPVARGLAIVDDDPVGDGIVDAGNDDGDAQPVNPIVTGLEHLGEVQAGVDLQHRERDLRRVEGLLGESEHHDRVLATAEHQHRLLELCRDLAEDVDRLRFQLVELTQPVVGVGVGHAK